MKYGKVFGKECQQRGKPGVSRQCAMFVWGTTELTVWLDSCVSLFVSLSFRPGALCRFFFSLSRLHLASWTPQQTPYPPAAMWPVTLPLLLHTHTHACMPIHARAHTHSFTFTIFIKNRRGSLISVNYSSIVVFSFTDFIHVSWLRSAQHARMKMEGWGRLHRRMENFHSPDVISVKW